MIYTRIAGTGSYVPKKIVTNHDLSKHLDTSDEWIFKRTGIKHRHIASDTENTATLALHASHIALKKASITPDKLDLIIVATSTPVACMPSTACILQDLLKLKKQVPAFDINAACSGFVYSMSIADQFVKSSQAQYVLIVGSDTFSRILDWEDRKTCVLFGDGAGAMVLEASENPGILSTHLYAEGSQQGLLYTDPVLNTPIHVHMEGRALYRQAVDKLAAVVEHTLNKNKIPPEDIDWLIPHQANIRIIKMMAEKLKLPMHRVIVTLQEHANTSAASIPLAFDTAIKNNSIQRDQIILFEAFGAGLTWGTALVKF